MGWEEWDGGALTTHTAFSVGSRNGQTKLNRRTKGARQQYRFLLRGARTLAPTSPSAQRPTLPAQRRETWRYFSRLSVEATDMYKNNKTTKWKPSHGGGHIENVSIVLRVEKVKAAAAAAADSPVSMSEVANPIGLIF